MPEDERRKKRQVVVSQSERAMKAVIGWMVYFVLMVSQAGAQPVKGEVFSLDHLPSYDMYFSKGIGDVFHAPALPYPEYYSFGMAPPGLVPYPGFYSLWRPVAPLSPRSNHAGISSLTDRNSEIVPVEPSLERQVYDWCGSFQPTPRDPLTTKAIGTPAERGESVIGVAPAIQPSHTPDRNDAVPPRRTVPGRGPRTGHAGFPMPR